MNNDDLQKTEKGKREATLLFKYPGYAFPFLSSCNFVFQVCDSAFAQPMNAEGLAAALPQWPPAVLQLHTCRHGPAL